MRRARGFTLIELIATIAVGSVIVGGMVLFAGQQMRHAVLLRDQGIALGLAQRYMAESNNVAYVSLTGTTTFAADASFAGYRARRIVTTLETLGGVSLKQVEIRVAYATDTAFANPLARLWTFRQSAASYGRG